MRKINVVFASCYCLTLLLLSCVPQQLNSTASPQLNAKSCPNTDNSKTFQFLTDNTEALSVLQSKIEEFLNSGGNVRKLMPLILDTQNNEIGSLKEIDLDDDGVNEIILSTTSPNGTDRKYGWVGVYKCSNKKYISSYSELGSYIEYATINSIGDLLGTGTPQIFVEYQWKGNGCTVGLQVLAFSSNKWSWVFGNYLNCPASVFVDVEKAEIVYTGIKHDFMGFEPDKNVTEIFIVQNGKFELVSK